MKTLDDQVRSLDEQMVLIADAEGPTSIAGVMGGARSEVHPGTTRVLMEAATWNGPNVHRTSLSLGLRSEASGRFEKGLEPEQTMYGQAVAAQLMVQLCGARLIPGTVDVGGAGPAPERIRLREARLRGLLGVEVPRARQAEILTALEFGVADADDGLDVTVPAFRRADVTREADLIEEVARLGALDILPAKLPSRHGASGRLTAAQRLRRRAVDALAGQGLHEVVGWSFASAELARRLRIPDRPAVALANPMSAEQARLRTTLIGSLLDVAARNHARGASRLALFEAGAVYRPVEGGARPDEPLHLAALLSGPVRVPTWREPDPPAADFYAAKGVLAGVLGAIRVPWALQASDPEPFLHPGRAARILVGGEPCGWIGEVHPLVAAEWDRSQAPVAFELDLGAAIAHVTTTRYADLTSFPEVREDLAVIVADTVTAEQVGAVVTQAGRPLLRAAEVFDVYRDAERVGEDQVSLALRLSFRAPDRTLTDDEVAAQRRAIVAALAEQLAGRVRDA